MSYLITGAQGCIGAWVVRNLARRGESVTVLDRETEPKRLRLLMNPAELAKIRFVTADITDYAAVAAALEGADKVIHLAALQVPACQADPLLGARVNVLGTLNLFEAAARQGLRRVVYASSCAVAGAPDEYSGEFTDASACQPHTHYGVYKLCNEGNARVYFETRQLSSIGLRPGRCMEWGGISDSPPTPPRPSRPRCWAGAIKSALAAAPTCSMPTMWRKFSYAAPRQARGATYLICTARRWRSRP